MKIIEPSAYLQTPENTGVGLSCLRKIETLARISHRSESKQDENSWESFIREHVLKHGDWSVTEHASATVIFRVDRGITHELVRHRLFSFTQESTRFVRYGGKMVQEMEFIRPLDIPEAGLVSSKKWFDWIGVIDSCEEAYFNLLENGARPQEARSVLPNSLASTIAMTGNLRSWRWFFLARTTQESHPDMRRVTIPLLEEFKTRIPLLYEDVEPLQKQSISMAKTH